MSMKLKTILFLLLLSISSANAHSWYPMECCSDGDCKPVPCEEITEQDNGAYKYQGVLFPKRTVKLSPDKFCHACMSETKVPYCIYIQTNS